MSTRCIATVIVLISFCSAALSSQPAAPIPPTLVCLDYEFTLTIDGKPHDIKLSRAYWAKDGSDASDVLTNAETAAGARLIADHPFHWRLEGFGKKNQYIMLLDTKWQRLRIGLTIRRRRGPQAEK